jgi:hypothetical protein
MICPNGEPPPLQQEAKMSDRQKSRQQLSIESTVFGLCGIQLPAKES